MYTLNSLIYKTRVVYHQQPNFLKSSFSFLCSPFMSSELLTSKHPCSFGLRVLGNARFSLQGLHRGVLGNSIHCLEVLGWMHWLFPSYDSLVCWFFNCFLDHARDIGASLLSSFLIHHEAPVLLSLLSSNHVDLYLFIYLLTRMMILLLRFWTRLIFQGLIQVVFVKK